MIAFTGPATDSAPVSCAVEACPLCGSNRFESTGPEAPGLSATAGDERFTHGSYFVRRCLDCGLLFRDPTLSQADLDRYYAKIDFRGWERDGYFPTERRVLELLRRLPRNSRILDFGCSSGRLLAGLCGQHQCYGIEVNVAAAAEAAKKGLTMLSFQDAISMLDRKFDAIVMVDVFEHLAHPLDLLQQLVTLLAEGGVLILVTGNGEAPACRRDPGQFWYFRNVEHLCMLTRQCADFLCDRLGLRIEQWVEMSHYDASISERMVQLAQNFVFWQFRNQTFLARRVLNHAPGMERLKTGLVAPTFSCSRDHVVAEFRRVQGGKQRGSE